MARRRFAHYDPLARFALHSPLPPPRLVLPVSLVLLTTGLVLGVFAMLYGTERQVVTAIAPHERRNEHDPAAEPSPFFNLASLAAFSFAFGLSAYLLTRYTALPIAVQIVIATLAGGGTMTVQVVLIARWAIPSARAEHVDERYLLQGTIGRTTSDIPANGTGTMQYLLDGRTYPLPARSLDGSAISDAADVCIDRVETGVAYVELWAHVEARL